MFERIHSGLYEMIGHGRRTGIQAAEDFLLQAARDPEYRRMSGPEALERASEKLALVRRELAPEKR